VGIPQQMLGNASLDLPELAASQSSLLVASWTALSRCGDVDAVTDADVELGHIL